MLQPMRLQRVGYDLMTEQHSSRNSSSSRNSVNYRISLSDFLFVCLHA